MNICFTDGAARGNPGPAGWGAVVATEKKVKEIGGRIENGTNNQAELTALAEALKLVDTGTFYVDSKYAINGATKWRHGWAKNGWKTSKDEPVKNQKLWKQIAALLHGKNISFEHVKGHAGIPANERADDIATGFADDADVKLYDGSRSDYSVSLNPESTELDNAPVYLSLIGDEVMQHENWADCKRRVDGRSAQFRKIHTAREREVLLDEWGVTLEKI